MSPAETLRGLYADKGLDFDWYARWHADHGFFFATPDFCIMGRAVSRAWGAQRILETLDAAERGESDMWFIHAMAGNCSAAWSIMPWPLGWIGFQRFDSDLRCYPTETIRRLSTVNNGDPASTPFWSAA